MARDKDSVWIGQRGGEDRSINQKMGGMEELSEEEGDTEVKKKKLKTNR